jgi:catechol 2,3-dioxygenase-like lactoylglutathione lyase family enzyme
MGKSHESIQDKSMKKNIPFHIGILVADLPAAIKEFSDVLGLQFGAVQEMSVNARGAVEGKIKMKVAYSTEGPVYIELIQGDDRDSLFSLKNGEGLHHLGVWSEDFAAYQERESRNKLPAMITMNVMPGDPTYWFSDPADLCGIRLEFLDCRIRKGMEAWIHGEDLS